MPSHQPFDHSQEGLVTAPHNHFLQPPVEQMAPEGGGQHELLPYSSFLKSAESAGDDFSDVFGDTGPYHDAGIDSGANFNNTFKDG